MLRRSSGRYSPGSYARGYCVVSRTVCTTICKSTSRFQKPSIFVISSSKALRDMGPLHIPKSSSPDQSEDILQAHSAASSITENVYEHHLMQTLSKWSTKIRAVTPRLAPGLKVSGSSFDSTSDVQDIIQQQLHIHEKDPPIRTRNMLSAARLGALIDFNTFTDTDFYLQLLRDVMVSKGLNGAASENESRTWLQLAERSNKPTDTKASKGRRLRYELHHKLQQFMIPIPIISEGWSDEQIDELFCSLAV